MRTGRDRVEPSLGQRQIAALRPIACIGPCVAQVIVDAPCGGGAVWTPAAFVIGGLVVRIVAVPSPCLRVRQALLGFFLMFAFSSFNCKVGSMVFNFVRLDCRVRVGMNVEEGVGVAPPS